MIWQSQPLGSVLITSLFEQRWQFIVNSQILVDKYQSTVFLCALNLTPLPIEFLHYRHLTLNIISNRILLGFLIPLNEGGSPPDLFVLQKLVTVPYTLLLTKLPWKGPSLWGSRSCRHVLLLKMTMFEVMSIYTYHVVLLYYYKSNKISQSQVGPPR